MGWVSVVGMGWVSLSRVRMGWVCGQDGEGLSHRDGVGVLYIFFFFFFFFFSVNGGFHEIVDDEKI